MNEQIEITPKQTSFLEFETGKRKIAKAGFSVNALEEHLREHCEDPKKWRRDVDQKFDVINPEWCDPYCGARVFFGRASEENRVQMRKRFSRAANEFLDRHLLLLREKNKYGAIIRVKLFDRTNPKDRQWAERQRKAAIESGELSQEKLEKINSIMGERSES